MPGCQRIIFGASPAEQPGEVKAREQQAARLIASAWVFVKRQQRPIREHGDIRVAARFLGDHAAGDPRPAAVAASACGATLRVVWSWQPRWLCLLPCVAPAVEYVFLLE